MGTWDEATRRMSKIQSIVDRLSSTSADRRAVLFGLAVATSHLPGDAAEVGVYKGGTLGLIAVSHPGRTVHAFDTFTGMPDQSLPDEYHKKGDFGDTTLGEVREVLSELANVVYHPGRFPDTASENVRYNFVHFDGDLYASCLDAITYFHPRLVPGGIMVFDDYDLEDCPGVRKAIERAGLVVACIAKNQCFYVHGAGS